MQDFSAFDPFDDSAASAGTDHSQFDPLASEQHSAPESQFDPRFGISRRMSQASAPKDYRHIGDFEAGVAGGVKNMKAMWNGFLAATGEAVGNDDLKAYGLAGMESNEAEAQLYQQGRPSRVEDIDSVGSFIDYAQYTLGSLAPFALESALSAIAGAAIGSSAPGAGTVVGGAGGFVLKKQVKDALRNYAKKQVRDEAEELLAKQTLAKVGAATGAIVGGYPLHVGDAYDETIKAGSPNPGAAFGAAVPMAALDAVVPAGVAGRLMGQGAGSMASRAAKGAVADAGKEGLTELGQEEILVQMRGQLDPEFDLTGEEANSRRLNSFVAGALGGAATGGVSGAMSRGESAEKPEQDSDSTPDISQFDPLAEAEPAEQAPVEEQRLGLRGVLQRRGMWNDGPVPPEPAPTGLKAILADKAGARRDARGRRIQGEIERSKIPFTPPGSTEATAPDPYQYDGAVDYTPEHGAPLPAGKPYEYQNDIEFSQQEGEQVTDELAQFDPIEAPTAEAVAAPAKPAAIAAPQPKPKPKKPAENRITSVPFSEEARAEYAKAAATGRLPEGLRDARLIRTQYRGELENMAKDFVKGGGVSYVRNDNDVITGRTASVNPDWFQSMSGDSELSMSTDGVKTAVDLALKGRRLGVRQARVVGAMLDTITGKREDYARILRSQRDAVRASAQEAQRLIDLEYGKLDPSKLTYSDADAGEVYAETDYPETAAYVDRVIAELAHEALQLGASAQEVDNLFDQSGPAAIIRGLKTIIQRAQHERPETTQEGNADAAQSGRNPADAEILEGKATDSPQAADQETLTSYTEADLAARDKAAKDAERKQAKADAEAEQRAQAQADARDFTLTGSDRAADVAEARGQKSIFDTPEPTKPADSGVTFTQGAGHIKHKVRAERNGVSSLNFHESREAAVADLEQQERNKVELEKEAEQKDKVSKAIAGKLTKGEVPTHAEWKSILPNLEPHHTYVMQPEISGFLKQYMGVSPASIRKTLGAAGGVLRSDMGGERPVVYLGKLAQVFKKADEKSESKPRKGTPKEQAPIKREQDGAIVSADEYPTQAASQSYSGISHQGSSRAKSDRDAYIETVQSLYDEALALAETDAQREALESALQKFKHDYISETNKLISVRSGAYSSHVAGRSKFNAKQANSRNSALDKANNRFVAWLESAKGSMKRAVEGARSPEQLAAIKKEKDEKEAAKKAKNDASLRSTMEQLLSFEKGNGLKIGGYPVARVSYSKGYPTSFTVDAADLTDNKFDLAKILFNGDKQKLRELVDDIRADSQPALDDATNAVPANVAPNDKRPGWAKELGINVGDRINFPKDYFYAKGEMEVDGLFNSEVWLVLPGTQSGTSLTAKQLKRALDSGAATIEPAKQQDASPLTDKDTGDAKEMGKTESAPDSAPDPTQEDQAQSATDWTTMGAEELLDAIRSIHRGELNFDQYQELAAAFRERYPALRGELAGMKKQDILDLVGPSFAYRYKSDRKDEVADGAIRAMADGLGITGSMSHDMSAFRSLDAYIASVFKSVDRVTREQFDSRMEKNKAEAEERQSEHEKALAGMGDPKTLDDFIRASRAKMSSGKPFSEARMEFSVEQRAEFDRLAAEKSRGERGLKKEARKTEIKTASQKVDGQIIETKHTKKGHDLFVVQLGERVDREDYNRLNASAKRLGGYYSSYRGGGAVPGFQFTDRESAEAFSALLGGDTAKAEEIAKENYDAFADDKKQSAAERLRTMAGAMDDRADATLGADRKVNTARRARMAAGITAAAESDKAMADTMRKLADGLDSGAVTFLDGVRQKVQVDMLNRLLSDALYRQRSKKYTTYSEQEKHKHDPADTETADFVEFPIEKAYRSDLARLGRQLAQFDGAKKISDRLLKVADDVTDAYLAFAKENFHKVSTFTNSAGQLAAFKTKAMAEEAIARSGFRGEAIVFSVKRGENAIIMSPEAARQKGVWQGDDDKVIGISKELSALIVEKANELNRGQTRVDVPWSLALAHERRKRLAAMNIETPAELRAAMREYIGLKQYAKQPDKIQELERSMIGRKNDGLDFFPTPEAVAMEMIEAAELEPGMSVLEPSAGMGHLAEHLSNTDVALDVVEFSGDRRELLSLKGFNVIGSDFLEMSPRGFTFGDTFRAPDGKEGIMRGGNGGLGSTRVRLFTEDHQFIGHYTRDDLEGIRKNGTRSGYDRIVMNPPFSDRRDAEHVQHAYTLLKPGGRIVAIMGEGVFFGQDKKAQAFRQWLDDVGGESSKLPEGSFMDASLPVTTGVNARMVVINKPEAPSDPSGGRFSKSPEDRKAERAPWGDFPDKAGTPQLNQSGGMTVEAVESAIAKRVLTFKNNNLAVRVVPDADGLPDSARYLMEARGDEVAPRGFYDPNENTVYLVAEQLKSSDEARAVLEHEAVGHLAVEMLLGSNFRPFIEKVMWLHKHGDKTVRQAARLVESEYGADWKKLDEIERGAEVVAKMAELRLQGSEFSKRASDLWTKIVQAVKRMLEAAGVDIAFSASDVDQVLMDAGNLLRTKGGRDSAGKGGFAKAYHGTPHKFDKFSLDAIGSGEGTQAFGWGLYFASKKAVAEYYRDSLGGLLVNGGKATIDEKKAFSVLKDNGDSIDDAVDDARLEMERNAGASAYVAGIYRRRLDVLESWKKDGIPKFTSEGSLYHVDIPEDTDLLDWDKPVDQQGDAAIRLFANGVGEFGRFKGKTGGEAYRMLAVEMGSEKAVSELFGSLGVPGLRFLDNTSRHTSGGELIGVWQGSDPKTMKDEGRGKWYARIKGTGGFATSKPFDTKAEAEAWAESKISDSSYNYVIWDEDRVTVEAVNDELRQARMSKAGRFSKSATATTAGNELLTDVDSGAPIDRAFRKAFELAGLVNEQGTFEAPQKTKALARAVGDAAGRFYDQKMPWAHHWVDIAKRGLIDRYGLDLAYLKEDDRRAGHERRLLLQAQTFLENLKIQGVDNHEEAKVLHAILTGKDVDRDDLKALAQPIREAIDAMGREAVELGLISEESYQRNAGSYLHRSYLKHEDQETGLSRWANHVGRSRRRKIVGNELKRRGLTLKIDPAQLGVMRDSDVVQVFKAENGRRRYEKAGTFPPDGWRDLGVFEVRRDGKGVIVGLWRDWTEEERQSMGEILDARYAIAKTYRLMAHDLAVGRFYKAIANNSEWSKKQLDEGDTEVVRTGRFGSVLDDGAWVKVPDVNIPKSGAKKWGALAGRYVRSEIWRDLNELEAMNRPSFWQKLMTQWKLNKTARNPVVHLNNVMSNLLFMDMADVRMRDLYAALKSMRDQDQDYKDALENGAFGSGFVDHELRRGKLDEILAEIKKQATNSKGFWESALPDRVQMLGKVMDGIWSGTEVKVGGKVRKIGIKPADEAMMDAYQMEDEMFRMATYLRRRALGDDTETAAHTAREQFLNYDIRAPWINLARQSVLPFIGYTYRAVPVIAKSLAERPWKVAKYVAVAEAINALGYALAPGDEDEERRALSEDQQGGTWLGVPRMLRMPFRDGYGDPVFLDIRRWIPAGDVFDTNVGQAAVPIPAPLQWSGPLMLAAELMLNKQAFTGKEIINEKTDDSLDKMQKVADWGWKSWMPSAIWIPNSWYWEKMEKAIKGGRDSAGRVYSVPLALSSSFGIKVQPLNVEQARYFQTKGFDQIERALKYELTATKRLRERGMLSLSQYQQEVWALRRKLNELAQERRRVLSGE